MTTPADRIRSAAAAAPTGLCFCDCGEAAAPGAYFCQGHDKRAQRYLTAVQGGQSIAEQLIAQGFIPRGAGRSLRDAALAADPQLEPCGRTAPDGTPCRVIGRGQGIRRHRAANDRHA